MSIICDRCGVTFLAIPKEAKAGRRFCSEACFHAPRPEAVCERCGCTFQPDRAGVRFCSKKCSWTAITEARLAILPPRMHRSCKQCGQAFSVKRSLGHRRFCSAACGNASRVGRPLPEMVRRKMQTALQRRFDAGPTSIETQTYDALALLGLDFERQASIGHFIVDAYVPALKLVIEVHGDYWHCNPTVYPDGPQNAIQRKDIKRDRAKRTYLHRHGYQLVELWERDIREVGAKTLLELALKKEPAA